MEDEYYNKFYLSDKLAQSISSIITQKEDVDCVCCSISITIPEHKGFVFSSPLDSYNCYGGGLNSLNGSQMRAINEKYGRYVEGNIPAEDCSFLIVMEREVYDAFSKLSFSSKEEIEETLQRLSIISHEYDGVFDSNIFTQAFPYLNPFFECLNESRIVKGMVTVDSDDLNKGFRKILIKDNKR